MTTHSRQRLALAQEDAERSLLEAIAAGDLDHHLGALAVAIHARRQLHTVDSVAALARLCVGDLVRVNERVSPRYLAGRHGTIVALDAAAATVRLDQPIGRFESGRVRCPPLALDRLTAA